MLSNGGFVGWFCNSVGVLQMSVGGLRVPRLKTALKVQP